VGLDNAKNFAKVAVSTGYSSSATSIVLNAGNGALLPTAPFNATWWDWTDYADPSDDPNVEIVRVTLISTDTLTVTRAQESTTATAKNISGKTYKMVAGITAKVINTDVWSSPAFTGIYSATAQPQSSAYQASAQTIPNAAATAVTFDTNVYDVGPIHSTSVNNTRFTAPVAGLYLITAAICFSAGTGYRELTLSKNGTGFSTGIFGVASSGVDSSAALAAMIQLNATDYVEAYVTHNNGSSLTLVASASLTGMQVVKLN